MYISVSCIEKKKINACRYITLKILLPQAKNRCKRLEVRNVLMFVTKIKMWRIESLFKKKNTIDDEFSVLL